MAKKPKSLAATGDAMDDAFQHEEERQEQRATERASGLDRVFRFGIKPGEEAEIILLDEDYHDGVAFYEHHMRDSQGKWTVFRPCVSEVASCPVCEGTDSKPYFAMYLTALHLNAYQDKKTKEWRHSRVLLQIKSISIPTFKKVMSAAMKKHGTLRGVCLNLERPKGAATSSTRIGEPVEYEDTGTRFDFVDDLEDEFGHDAIKAKDGTVFKEANVNITSYDYEALFPLTFDVDRAIAELNKEFGDRNHESAEDVAKEWDDDSDDNADDDAKTTSRKSRKKRRKVEDEDDDDDIDMSSPKRKSKKTRSRKVEVEDDDDESSDDGSGDEW
jgi:hypothetical protein